MKTGKPKRLSEKLNADLDMIQQEHAASMASQLENFRADLNSIAQHVHSTIETDTQHFLRQNRNWFETRTSEMKRWLKISPWLIVGLITAVIASMMAASWLWVAIMTRSEMTDLGLTRINQDGQIWLVMDPQRTALKNCRMAGTPVLCIEIKER
jgi:hypothetical protein